MNSNASSSFPEFKDRDDLSLSSLQAFAHRAVDWMFEYLQSPGGKPIYPDQPTSKIFESLKESLPEQGSSPLDILAEFQDRIVPYASDLQHPGNLAYIPNSAGVVGIVADLLAATLNQNVSLVRGGPSAAAVEQQVVDWLRTLVGYAHGGGVLTSGGSIANLMGLGLARHRAGPHRELIFYVSEETHSSIDRALRFLGVSDDAVRRVATDERFTLRMDALADAIRVDREARRIPACVIGTAGTIGSGAVDPLEEIGALCRRETLWFHVDGAYGALAATAPSGAWMRAGLAAADSISLDPHKWLFVPLDTSCLLVKDVAFMREIFTVVPEYLKVLDSEKEGAIHQPMEHTLELSRRFRALRLWMSLKTYGAENVRAKIEEHLLLAKSLAERVERSELFELMAPVMTSTVCFRYAPQSMRGKHDSLDSLNETMMHRINEHSGLYISRNRLRGRFTLRVCITHLRTSEPDITRFWEVCQDVATQME